METELARNNNLGATLAGMAPSLRDGVMVFTADRQDEVSETIAGDFLAYLLRERESLPFISYRFDEPYDPSF